MCANMECSSCVIRLPFGFTATVRIIGFLLLSQNTLARREWTMEKGQQCSVWKACTQQEVGFEGVLVFWSPFHDPRVHENAPAAMHVTTVRALDESAPGKPVAYSLLDVKDSSYFHLNHVTGNMTTARPITRNVGDKYEVIVAAVSQGVTEVKTMQIEVTVPNQYPPRFEHSVYHTEVHQTRTRPGYRGLQVRAHDPDPVPYNAEVYYRLEAEPESTRALRYLALDGITGEVMLNRSLADVADSTIAFTVIAEDGGSPQKHARA